MRYCCVRSITHWICCKESDNLKIREHTMSNQNDGPFTPDAFLGETSQNVTPSPLSTPAELLEQYYKTEPPTKNSLPLNSSDEKSPPIIENELDKLIKMQIDSIGRDPV